MSALWVFSGAPNYFLAPKSEILVDASGKLLPSAMAYVATIHVAEDFCQHLDQANIVILVAENKLFNAEFLAAIPHTFPKLTIICDNAPAEVRQQLNTFRPDGYLFGGFSAHEFLVAMDKAYSDKTAVMQIQEELQKYTNIAFTAMSSASEIGVVALFAERAQTVMDISRLAQLTLNCFRDLNVDGVIQFSFEDEADVAVYPSTAPAPYKQLLTGARRADSRIISRGRFLVFSFTHVQLLITDAPFEDVERYGRLRDIIAPIVSITEARLKTLKVNELLKAQQDNARMVMMLLDMASRDNRESVKTIMMELSLSLREMSSGLELTLAQENALLGLSEGALESLETLHEATGAVEEHFHSLLAQLDTAASLLHVHEAQDLSAATDSKVELF